jgi:O-antigen/teichoic acid export membrane protein
MSQGFAKDDVVKVAKGAGTTLIGGSLGKGLFLLSHILIARLLGAEAFGLYSLGFAAAKMSSVIACLGLDTGGMRFVSIYRLHDSPRLKGTMLAATGLPLLIGSLVGAGLYVSAALMAQQVFHKPELAGVLEQFALSIPFAGSLLAIGSLLQGFHTTKYAVFTRDIVQSTANLGLIFVFYYAGMGLKGIIYAFVLSHVLAVVVGIYYFPRLFPAMTQPDVRPIYPLKELVSYSTPLLFVGFLHFFLSWTDTLMLGVLGTTRDVGIYRAASQIPLVMTMFLAASNSIYAPVVADLFQQREMQRLENLLKTTTRWLTFVAFPLSLLFMVAAPEILLLFGRNYLEIGPTVVILFSIRQLISCSTGGLGVTLAMTHSQTIELYNSIAMVAMNVLLNYLLIPRYGAIGAAVSSCLSGTAINLIRVLEVQIMYRVHPFTPSLLKYLLPAAPALAMAYVIQLLGGSLHPALLFMLKLTCISLPFCVYFTLTKDITDEDSFIYNRIINTIKKVHIG